MNRWLDPICNCLLSLFLLMVMLACSTKQRKFGDWTHHLPQDPDFIYAVGGPDPDRPIANDHARSELAKTISVMLESEVATYLRAKNEQVDTGLIEQVRTQSKEILHNVQLVEVKEVRDGYYVLARMPMGTMDLLLDPIRYIEVPPRLREIAQSIILPGWGQFEKEQRRKGVNVFVTQSALLSGYLIGRALKVDAHNQFVSARAAQARQAWQDRVRDYDKVCLISLIGAGIVYLYNMIDISTTPRRIKIDQAPLSLQGSPHLLIAGNHWQFCYELP